MYKRINVVNILFLFIVFSMNPIVFAYLFKYNYYMNVFFIALVNLIFFYCLIKNRFVLYLPKSLKVIFLIHILIIVNTLFMYQKVTHELLFFSFFIELLILSFLLVNDAKALINKIVFIIKIILVLNLIVFVSVNIFKLPYSQIILHINGEYVRHHFMYLGFVLNHQENLLGWSFHRVHSYFTEPAQFSTFLVLLILILKIDNYKGSYKLFWINGFLSFSMMFYIFFFIYIFFKLFKSIKASYMILFFFILQVIISFWLINYVDFKEFSSIANGSIDPQNSFLMKAGSIMSRLDFFYNNIRTGTLYPFGIGYADNIDQQSLLYGNLKEKAFVGIRSATGLSGTFMAVGGIFLLLFLFTLLIKMENTFKNNSQSIYYIRSGLVLFSLFSTSSFFSAFVAVMIGITYKNFLKKEHKCLMSCN